MYEKILLSSYQGPMCLKLVTLFPFRNTCSYFAFILCSFFVLVNFNSSTFKAGQLMPNYYEASFSPKSKIVATTNYDS